MRRAGNQHFWSSVLLLAVHMGYVTTAPSGANTLSADLDVTHRDHFRNIHILTSNVMYGKQKLPSGHRNFMELTSVEAIPHGNKQAPDVMNDASQSHAEEGEYETITNNYSYVFEKNTVNPTSARLHNLHGSKEDTQHHLFGLKNQPSKSSTPHKVFKNTGKHRVIATETDRQFKARLIRSVQGEHVPPNNEDGNNTITDLSTEATSEAVTDLSNRESNISFSKENMSTTSYTSHEQASVNSIYESEFSNEVTTPLSNVIPRGPAIHNISPVSPEPKLTKETKLKPSLKTNITAFEDDSSNMIDSPTITRWRSSDLNLNQNITESFHASDSEESTITKFMLPPQDNTNSHADDVPNEGDIVKFKRKLSEDPENNKGSESKESSRDILLEISLSNSGDSLLVNWIFVSNNTQVSGFQVSYRMNNREDFDSSSLDISVRSFALHSLHEDEHYVICVHAMINKTAVRKSCAEWSKSSMKMVVGILAGTIFLIPCIVVIVWILYKDYKMKQKNRLQLLNDHMAPVNRQFIARKDIAQIRHQNYHDEVKGLEHGKIEGGKMECDNVEGGKAEVKASPTQASLAYTQKMLTKSTQATGHDNPCEHAADDSTDDDDAHGPWQRLRKEEADMVSIPLHDEILSTSSAASISSKNNVTYIMIRQNPGASNDIIPHQNIAQTENLSPSLDSIHL